MTLHIVLGDGSMNTKELGHQLDDILDAHTTALPDQNFWFILEGKAELTKTDNDLVAWLESNDIYYDIVAVEGAEVSDTYHPGEQHAVDSVVDDILDVFGLAETDDEGAQEDAVLLGIFINPKDDDAKDVELITCVEKVLDAGHKVFALNDSMEPITLESPDQAEESNVVPIKPDDRTDPPKPAKAAAKKAAPKAVTETPPGGRPAPGSPLMPYTRIELEGLTGAEVKAIADGEGITEKGKPKQIDAILAQQNDGEVPTQPPADPDEKAVTNAYSSNIGTTTGASNISTGTATTTFTGTTGATITNSGFNYLGHNTLPTDVVMVVIITPNGTIITKMVPYSKVSLL